MKEKKNAPLKFVRFPEAQAAVAGGLIPYYLDESGLVVVCAELTPDDIKVIKQTGKIWAVFGPGFVVPPPCQLMAVSPMVPATDAKVIPLTPLTDGKETTTPSAQGPSNDQQPDKSNN